jgi:transcriptional regulator with PAS, ATPase and Fis domain
MLEFLAASPGTVNHFPIVVSVDSLGKIKNCFPEGKISCFKPGNDIHDFITDIEIETLINKETQGYISIGEDTYHVHSYPFESKNGAMLYFENIVNSSTKIFLNNPYVAFIFIDNKGIIRLVNEALVKYSKFPKSELIGRHINDINLDPKLYKVLETKKPDLLSIFSARLNIVVSRHPIFEGKECIGVYAWYISIDQQDIKNNHFGENYVHILDGLQVNTISQALIKLNNYMHEFYETNRTEKGIESIIGNSRPMVELKERLIMVADSPSSILITGESGTGKGLVAEAIHFHSSRNKYPFVKVNCAAIPDSLLESELFGYVDGAFTGARKGGKIGKFELANKGIIFLDEIGDMPLAMQAKLLRVIQEREVERLGSENVIPIDVRIISATNKDLLSMVKLGNFRADLYYRLNVINFQLTPLRERKQDIPLLINYFIKTLSAKLNKNIKGVSSEVMDQFMRYNWPGNARELINVLEAAMNFCRSNLLGVEELPKYFLSEPENEPSDKDDLYSALEDLKKPVVISALEKCSGKRKDAAELLGISKSTLYRLMKKYDLIED